MPSSTFYKWRDRELTGRQVRRTRLDQAVRESFDDSGGTPGTYGSPRVFEDPIADGWVVSVNTVASSMARQGLQGRARKRKRRGLTRPDKAASPIGDLVKRDFNAETINQKWCGDLERHEALLNRAVVKGHRPWSVVADRVKLRAA